LKARLSQDVWVLLALFLFLVVITIFAAGKRDGGTGIDLIPRRTTYSARPGGLRALYETLDKLGYRVSRRLEPFNSAPAGGVLFLISPEVPLSTAEWTTLRQWVEAGNLLVVSSDDIETLAGGEKMPTARSAPIYPSFLSPGVRAFVTPNDAELFDQEWSFEHGESCQSPFG